MARPLEPTSLTKAAQRLRAIFGRNLRLARKGADLNQRDLHALSGVSQDHISSIERGLKSAGIDTIANLAEHVGRTPAELLTDTQAAKRRR